MTFTVKSVIEIHSNEWATFKALAAKRETSVQAMLGDLVRREVRAAERREAQRLGRQKAAKLALAKAKVEFGA